MEYPFEKPTEKIRRQYRTQLLSGSAPIRAQAVGNADVFFFGTGKTHLLFFGAQTPDGWQAAAWMYRFLFYLTDTYTNRTDPFGISADFLFSRYTYGVFPVMYTEHEEDGMDIPLSLPENMHNEVRMSDGVGRLTWQSAPPPSCAAAPTFPDRDTCVPLPAITDLCVACTPAAAIFMDRGAFSVSYAETSGKEKDRNRLFAARIGRHNDLPVGGAEAKAVCGVFAEGMRRMDIPYVRISVPDPSGDAIALRGALFRTLYTLAAVL